MRRLLPLLLFAAPWLLIGATPTDANAQGRSKFALEFRVGFALPIEDYVETKTVLISEDNRPRIVDLTNEPTFANFSLLADIRDIELSLSVRQFAWGDSLIRYEGDRPAQELSEGNIDDAGVQYTRLDPPITTDEPLVSSNSLNLFTICAGQRIYILESGLFQAYIPATIGVSFAEVTSGSGNNVGVILATGVAADVVISDLIAVVLDARIHGMLTENASGVSQGAQNASATDGTIISALTSSMVFVTFDVGARFTLY
ncbi:MAG: hypothetical protein CMH57_00195 [Myxococcales bacterium]|nr:hypothetical protein [Myxococcales bacterium]